MIEQVEIEVPRLIKSFAGQKFRAKVSAQRFRAATHSHCYRFALLPFRTATRPRCSYRFALLPVRVPPPFCDVINGGDPSIRQLLSERDVLAEHFRKVILQRLAGKLTPAQCAPTPCDEHPTIKQRFTGRITRFELLGR